MTHRDGLPRFSARSVGRRRSGPSARPSDAVRRVAGAIPMGHYHRSLVSVIRGQDSLGIIATISNGFILLDISVFYQDIIKGSIIVGALALDVLARRLAARSR